MRNINIEKFQSAIRNKRIRWKKHLIQRLAIRRIKQKSIIAVLLNGKCIKEYPEDKPFPSGLFMGWVQEKPIHTIASYDEINDIVHIITAYEPSLEFFEPDYQTRKNS